MPQQPAAFAASGVVTLTTDFGLKDPFVGVMKGRLVARFPGVRIIDLTHEIPAHWPAEAGFWLARSFRYFPSGTVHVAVVDPGVGSAREIAAVEAEGHLFLAPDNGLLAPVLESAAGRHGAARGRPMLLARIGLDAPSATFHGRDIFAPLAAELAAGPPAAGGPRPARPTSWSRAGSRSRWSTAGQVAGTVVTIDHFGNLITNIDARHLHGLAHPVVRVGRPGAAAAANLFGRPARGLPGAGQFVRRAGDRPAERSAAEGLGLARGAPVSVVSK